MSRVATLSVALVTSVAALAGVPAAQAAQAAPQAAVQHRLTTAIPSSAALKDAHDDVEDFDGNKVSYPLDIYAAKVAKSGTNLVLTLTFDNLTKHNTEIVTTGENSYFTPSNNAFHLMVNGTEAWTVNRFTNEEGIVWKGSGADAKKVDCDGDSSNDKTGVAAAVNYVKDTYRYTVPLSCLPKLKTFKFHATMIGGAWEQTIYTDATKMSGAMTVG